MLKRDLILVQIEELGKVIVQMITNRNTGETRKNSELVQVVYDSLQITPDRLLTTSLEDILHTLDYKDGAGLQRMEIAAKTLLEEGYLHPEKSREIRNKAKEILEYVQKHDNTFSLERSHLLAELGEE